jgi:hypothetical protein
MGLLQMSALFGLWFALLVIGACWLGLEVIYHRNKRRSAPENQQQVMVYTLHFLETHFCTTDEQKYRQAIYHYDKLRLLMES